MVELEVVDPHLIINYLFDVVGVDIPASAVRSFWRHHHAVRSPWLETCEASIDHVPVALYGDGARCRQQAYRPVEKVLGLCLSLPLWRPKSSRFSRWLLFSIDETLLYKRKTLNAVFRRLVWSINSMFTGCFPVRDELGRPLNDAKAGRPLTKCGRAFAFTELRGDWSYFALIFGFNSSWKAGTNKSVCFLCEAFGAGNPGNQYYHIDENCRCWGSMYNKASFLAREMPNQDICYLPCWWH